MADINPVGETYFGFKPATPKPAMDMNAFMRLLTVQLVNQNPLEPMGDRDFFAQMAQLGQVQGLEQVNKSLNVAQAAGLMGKTITAVRPMTDSGLGNNTLISGVVKKLSVRNGEHYLGVQEANGGMVEVKMGSIQSVEG